MAKPLFSVGEMIRFQIDGQKYKVEAVSPDTGGVPGERLYFIVLAGRWPWQVMRTHTVPESVASKYFSVSK